MKVKNSNKVLLVMLVLIVTIPLLVAQVFLYRIRMNQFVLKENLHPADPALHMEGSLAGIKAIRLIGPLNRAVGPDILTTSILRDSNYTYSMNTYSLKKMEKSDSMMIKRVADTLVFTFYVYPISIDNPKYHYYNHLSLVLNIPETIPIYAENSTVCFGSSANDSLPADQEEVQSVYLKEHAVLQLGNKVLTYKLQPDTLVEGKTVFIIDSSEIAKQDFKSNFAYMKKFKVTADNSEIQIIQPISFRGLQLDLMNNSTLNLQHPIKTVTGSLSGAVDPDTKIIGDLTGVRSIMGLLKP